jgi:hypothetical protein
MTKSILLIVAGSIIGTAAIALPTLDLTPSAPAAAASAAGLVLTGLCDASAGPLVDDGRGGYLLLAGEPGEGGTFALWSWAGPAGSTPPRKVLEIPTEKDTSAEAIVIAPDRKSAWIIFDEGGQETASGMNCKSDSVPPAGKSFRARRVDLPMS